MTWEKIHYQKFDCFRPCRQECTGLRPSGVCKKVYQLNLRRRRENTRKYANPRLANATPLPPDGGKKCSLFCVFPSGAKQLLTQVAIHIGAKYFLQKMLLVISRILFMKKKKHCRKNPSVYKDLEKYFQCPSK